MGQNIAVQRLVSEPVVLVLVDSGTSMSFVSEQLLSLLSITPVQCQSVSVRVANGDCMQCCQQLPAVVWNIHHYQFTHPLKVLPISHYDTILGMDWL